MDERLPNQPIKSYLDDPDVVLMLAFQKGDPRSFEKLLVKYYPRVLAFIARFGIQRHAAEDLTQDIFLKIHNAVGQYHPRAKFQTWLFTVVRNAALNALRQDKKNAFSLDDEFADGESYVHSLSNPEGHDPQEQLLEKERAALVQKAVNDLPEQQRWAVLLKRYEQMSYEEIAATMNCSVASVKSLLNRAKENLAAALSKSLGEQ